MRAFCLCLRMWDAVARFLEEHPNVEVALFILFALAVYGIVGTMEYEDFAH